MKKALDSKSTYKILYYLNYPLLTLNQRVWGSSPQGITIEINKCESTFFVSYVCFL